MPLPTSAPKNHTQILPKMLCLFLLFIHQRFLARACLGRQQENATGIQTLKPTFSVLVCPPIVSLAAVAYTWDKVTGSLFGSCPLVAAWSANCPLFRSAAAEVCGRTPPMPIWGQTRCLCIKTKRQQAVALQTLRAYQRPLHPRQRVRNHWDQRALPWDGVAGHISQPGVAEGTGGARAGGVVRQATLVPAAPGWEIYGQRRTLESDFAC